MADNSGVYDISGQVQRVVTSSLAIVHSGLSASINERREAQRDRYDRLLKGTATRAEVAQSPFDSTPASPPSWTQVYAGKKHAFVISELSSSQHEVTSLNARISGTVQLENTAVPASGTLVYSKQSRFVTKIYKLSSSIALTQSPGPAEWGPSELENATRSLDFAGSDPVSGTYRNNSMWNPAIFEIDVPDYGKIRDIKVWVEFIHDHRGGVGTGSADASNIFWAGGTGAPTQAPRHGLQGMQIALRSPNTNFMHAHPLWNDPTVANFEKTPHPDIGDVYRFSPEILRNSYLLWAGHAVEEDLGISLGSTTGSLPRSYNVTTLITGTSGNAVTPASLEINGSDQPVIVYGQAQENRMVIFRRSVVNGTVTEAKETVPTNGYPNFITLQLASDKQTPHVMYKSGSASLLYVRSSSAGWIGPDNVSSIFSNTFPDLAVDSNGKAVIICSALDGQPSLFMSGTSGWERFIVGRGTTAGITLLAHSIRADRNNDFHFTYLYADDFGKWIFYGKTGSFGLSTERIATSTELNPIQTVSITPSLSIAVNSSNEPAIVVGGAFDGIKIFTSGTSGWTEKNHFSDIVKQTYVSLTAAYGAIFNPRDARYDADDNLHATFNGFANREVNTFGSFSFVGLLKSGSNGASFDYLIATSSLVSFNSTMNRSVAFDSNNRLNIMMNEPQSVGAQRDITWWVQGSGSDGSYHEFDTDIDMRTIFTDSSKTSNPRHLEQLYNRASLNSIGRSALHIEKVRIEGAYSSPLSSSIKLFGYTKFDPAFYQSSWLTGANFPWMLDGRVPPGNFQGRNWSATSSLGVPPGWLTGPGFTANENEFPTTGSQIGPPDIKPVYPLLDDVYVEKVTYQSPTTSIEPLPSGSNRRIIGFRPGLRGTEVHGKWQLMMANNGNFGPVGGPDAIPGGDPREGFWFRQFRLEFLIDQGEDINDSSFASRNRKYRRSSNVATHEGKRLVHIISGSAAWDIGTNIVYVVQNPEYGRSVGITSDKADTTYAVYSKITGTFAQQLSGSGRLQSLESSYLSNEFGTPYIPLSSGSGVTPNSDTYDQNEFKNTKRVFDAVFGRNTLIPSDNTLRAHITRDNVFMSSRDIASDAVNSSLSASSP